MKYMYILYFSVVGVFFYSPSFLMMPAQTKETWSLATPSGESNYYKGRAGELTIFRGQRSGIDSYSNKISCPIA